MYLDRYTKTEFNPIEITIDERIDKYLRPIIVVNRHGIQLSSAHYTAIKYLENPKMFVKFDDSVLYEVREELFRSSKESNLILL